MGRFGDLCPPSEREKEREREKRERKKRGREGERERATCVRPAHRAEPPVLCREREIEREREREREKERESSQGDKGIAPPIIRAQER